jgi:serine/threonine protein kinase
MTPIAAAPPQLNGYTFQRTLGSGGFADVHLYTQHRPQRPVAVKVLRAGLGDSALASFESEANLMAALSTHSSIVPIFVADVSPDGRPFLVMEYYSSPPLEKRIKAQPLSVSETLEYGIQLAGAVETAHRQGIIHRDIKPANVLISAGRKPVLTDFGISASAATGPVQGGMSVAWSAPEQINLQPTDGRADVYSLAATVYAMLSGHSPVIVPGQSNDQAAVMHRVFNVAPPRIARDDVPESLQRVLAVAMAKDPGQRYPSNSSTTRCTKTRLRSPTTEPPRCAAPGRSTPTRWPCSPAPPPHTPRPRRRHPRCPRHQRPPGSAGWGCPR